MAQTEGHTLHTRQEPSAVSLDPRVLGMLRCPSSGDRLRVEGNDLVGESGQHRYRVTSSGIPLFAEAFCSPEARQQQRHYDRIAERYLANLSYPHTEEYSLSLDRALLALMEI